ncbi:MAG: peptidylprolyl isomerase [Deltaproteobacteria bacterium]
MANAQHGDTVRIHFKGKLDSGEVFVSSFDRKPVEFTIGEGKVLPGIESAVVGMNEGESKTVDLPAEKAYGNKREELVVSVDRQQFAEDVNPEPGQRLKFRKQDGQEIIAKVTEVSPSSVTVDANHPLAGEDVEFDLELIEIV